MKQRITAFWNRWSPWRLQWCLEHYRSENERQGKVILQLGKDKAELERLLEK